MGYVRSVGSVPRHGQPGKKPPTAPPHKKETRNEHPCVALAELSGDKELASTTSLPGNKRGRGECERDPSFTGFAAKRGGGAHYKKKGDGLYART